MNDNPLYWEHGLFLQPQHFQLEGLHTLRRERASFEVVNPYLWGVRRCAINTAELVNGIFELVSLELLLPTGEWASLPGNAVIPARSFEGAWINQETPLTVHLALSGFKEQGNNVTRAERPEDASDGFRFLAPFEPEEIADLHGDGPTVQVSTLKYNFRIVFDGEDIGERWTMPLACLHRDGNRVKLDESFIPPCVDINASPMLHRLIRNVRDTLVIRSLQMGEYKITPGDVDTSMTSTLQSMTLFSILGVLSRNAPEMDFLLGMPCAHPCDAYRLLRRIIGELSIFTPQLTPLGEDIHGERLLPPYDHVNPAPCFQTAVDIISRVVDSMVSGPAFTFVLEPTDTSNVLKTSIPQTARAEHFTCWLLLRSSSCGDLADKVATLGKLAPPSDLAGIVGRALPGIRLIHTEHPPVGLPRRNDTAYFMIDTADRLWRQVQLNGDVAFMLPDRPDDLLAQIVFL